jgi:indole-3-glycerol phosphate synthase
MESAHLQQNDFLEKIIESKKRTIEQKKKLYPLEELMNNPFYSKKAKKFDISKSIRKPALIGEIKKSSPSKGVIKNDINPVQIAKEYEKNGAIAISVLTEENYFSGSSDILLQVSQAVNIPVLRKDFIIDEYQIYEAKAISSDLILLIANILEKDELKYFVELCKRIEIIPIIEVHSIDDIKKISDLDFSIIGINNRNLKTFEVDIKNTGYLRNYIPKDKIVISESGIITKQDIDYLRKHNVDAVLIGETLMRASNITNKIKELFG